MVAPRENTLSCPALLAFAIFLEITVRGSVWSVTDISLIDNQEHSQRSLFSGVAWAFISSGGRAFGQLGKSHRIKRL